MPGDKISGIFLRYKTHKSTDFDKGKLMKHRSSVQPLRKMVIQQLIETRESHISILDLPQTSDTNFSLIPLNCIFEKLQKDFGQDCKIRVHLINKIELLVESEDYGACK